MGDTALSLSKYDDILIPIEKFLLRTQSKLSFLLGFHNRLGVDSSIILYLVRHSMYQPALIQCIFELI